MKNWKQIADEKIRTVWVCPDCKNKARVSPDYFQDNGTPMCCDCDTNMEYLYTKIKED